MRAMPNPAASAGRLPALLAALFILAAGLAVAHAAMRWLEDDIAEESTERLDRLASRVRNAIEQRFHTPAYGLRGLRSAFAVEGELTRDQFRAVVATRDIPAEFPGVRGFGYAELVYRWSTVGFLERTRRDGAPDFAIRGGGGAPDMYIVKYFEPSERSAAALGLDLGSEALRRAAVDTAIETGEPALTGAIALFQDGAQRPSFLLVLPLYRHGTAPATIAERRAAARGVLYAPIIAAELVGDTAGVADGLVEFDLFDGSPDGDLRPFHSHREQGSAARQASLSFFMPMVIANRLIVMKAWGAPRWHAGIDRTTPLAAAAGIAAFSVALALAVWLLATARARAVALARGMTAELDRLAEIAERTTNGVIITDREWRIVWINDGFTRLTGYEAAEAIGRMPRDLVHDDRMPPEDEAEMLRCLAEHRPFRGEIRNRAKDGRLYWVDLEIRELFDRTGVFTGYMAIQAETTERREALERLEDRQTELKWALINAQEVRERLEVQASELAALAEQISGERRQSDLAHRRLKEAIESLSDAFCLYGPDERIVLFNAKYVETYGAFADLVVPGTSYELVVRLGIERGLYPAAAGREEAFVREHLEAFRNPPPAYEVRVPGGGWYRIEKRRTESGHTISFRVDISELKAKESALAALNADLERLATTDALTGVSNRRALLERGDAELARLRRFPGPCALLALDIDHFKRVNDTHGHAAGDAVLVEFARRIGACLRATDLFGRVGGEEFAVVAPGTDRAGARLLALRLIETARAAPVEIAGLRIAVTTSVGIAMLDPADADLSVAQRHADDALYCAKRDGRDRYAEAGQAAG